MTIYCKIENGIVVDRAVFAGAMPEDWPGRGAWVADETAQIGWAYDGEAFLPPPPAAEPLPGPVLIPYGEFRARWEPAELQGLFAAKLADWRVEDYVTLASAQGHVNLSGPTAAAAKALFLAMGVLTAERAEAIFAA